MYGMGMTGWVGRMDRSWTVVRSSLRHSIHAGSNHHLRVMSAPRPVLCQSFGWFVPSVFFPAWLCAGFCSLSVQIRYSAGNYLGSRIWGSETAFEVLRCVEFRA